MLQELIPELIPCTASGLITIQTNKYTNLIKNAIPLTAALGGREDRAAAGVSRAECDDYAPAGSGGAGVYGPGGPDRRPARAARGSPELRAAGPWEPGSDVNKLLYYKYTIHNNRAYAVQGTKSRRTRN